MAQDNSSGEGGHAGHAGHAHGPGHGDHAHHHGHDGECAHAHGRAERVPAALDETDALCEARGLRLTPIRRQVLEALYSNHRPASAYDLIETLARSGDKRHAPVTIYRALDFLLENGFAHRLESRNAFIACPFHHAPGEPVVFMICERCGGVDEAVSEELSGALARLTAQQGFRPRARVIELAGCCAHCT